MRRGFRILHPKLSKTNEEDRRMEPGPVNRNQLEPKPYEPKSEPGQNRTEPGGMQLWGLFCCPPPGGVLTSSVRMFFGTAAFSCTCLVQTGRPGGQTRGGTLAKPHIKFRSPNPLRFPNALLRVLANKANRQSSANSMPTLATRRVRP